MSEELILNAYLFEPLAIFQKLALDVYNKCRKTNRWPQRVRYRFIEFEQKKMQSNSYFSRVYEPAVTLSPVYLDVAPDVKYQTQFLHCAYMVSHNYVYLVWADSTGHLLETDVCVIEDDHLVDHTLVRSFHSLKAVLKYAHEKSVMYMKSVCVQQHADHRQVHFLWDYSIYRFGRSGHMHEQEIKGILC